VTSSIIGIDTTTKQRVEIPKPSRLRGLYIIGAPGTGKSGLIENLIIQDIEQDIGVCLLDPHGDLTYTVLARLPDRRVKDVILLDIADYHYPFGLNLFACSNLADPTEIQRTVDHVFHVFEKLFAVSRDTPLILQYLRNCTHTLVANPGYTMADIPLLLTDKNCRQQLLVNVKSSQVRLFWRDYDTMPPPEQRIERGNILRRVEEFLQDFTFPIVGQAQSTIDMRTVMDERKILLVKLDPRLEMVTSLIGSLIIALFLNAAYSRADLPVEKRKQFNIYADEFQRFATEDFAILFTEARKFGIALTVAHQMREQLDRQNRSATVNVANLIVFKVSSPDADELKGQFDTTPPPAEPQKEYVRTPTRKPVDFIVSGKSHPSEVVNTVLGKWKGFVERANESIRDVRVFKGTWKGKDYYDFVSNEAEIWQAQYELETINDLLYQVMLKKNPRQAVPITVGYWMAKRLGLPFYNVSNGSGYFSVLLAEKYGGVGDGASDEMKEAYIQLWLVPDEQLDQAFETFHAHVVEVIKVKYRLKLEKYFQWLYENFETGDEPYEILRLNREAQKNLTMNVNPHRDKPYFNYRYNEIVDAASIADKSLLRKYSDILWWEREKMGEREKEFELEKGVIPFQQLTYEIKEPYKYGLSAYFYGSRQFEWTEKDDKNLVIQGYSWRLKPGTLEEHMDVILEPVVEVGLRGRESFTAFVKELRALMQALATQPIEDISGVVEEKPGTTMTYADVANQIANELVKLDQYTARVKIASGVKSVEHIIQTLDPKKEHRLSDAVLNKRIADIQAQNIRDGYMRERAQVEDEIRRRQEQCCEPPGSPTLLEPSPEPPGSPRRKKIT